ncbi:MAG: nitroreductase family protein [Desulfurococcaceae archaeon]
MSYIDFLISRRSVRRFKREAPPLELVLKAIDAARFAPSAKNSQPWRFVVVTDPVAKEKLARLHAGARPLESAPLAVVVACDTTASPLSYLLDCSAATTYFLLALHALGLGAVWIQALRNVSEIRDIVGLPEHVFPVAVVAVGYPDEQPKAPPRKPLEELVFLNKYGSRLS